MPEVTCQSDLGGTITSGGGFSTYYPQPSWQSSAVNAYFSKVMNTARAPVPGFSSAGRGYPDVSLLGASYIVVIGGNYFAVSGTSASAPAFAGMVSLVNAARLASSKSSVGWINPTLYGSYQLYARDITSGRNNCAAGSTCCSQGYYAASGWDPLTGLGSINFQAFKSYVMSLGTANVSTARPTQRPTARPTARPTPRRTRRMSDSVEPEVHHDSEYHVMKKKESSDIQLDPSLNV